MHFRLGLAKKTASSYHHHLQYIRLLDQWQFLAQTVCSNFFSCPCGEHQYPSSCHSARNLQSCWILHCAIWWSPLLALLSPRSLSTVWPVTARSEESPPAVQTPWRHIPDWCCNQLSRQSRWGQSLGNSGWACDRHELLRTACSLHGWWAQSRRNPSKSWRKWLASLEQFPAGLVH